MKKLLFAMLVTVGVACFGDGLPIKITFRTSGANPDRYADGEVVADGEYYAFVWVRSGTTFGGFLADGSLVDPDNSHILALAALAEDGHCQTYAFQVSRQFIDKLGAGNCVLCLLDTRCAAGKLATTTVNVNNVLIPVAINGYGIIKDAEVTTEEVVSASTTTKVNAQEAAFADIAADLPGGEAAEELVRPEITNIDVRDGKVRVTLKAKHPYMKYNLKSGEAIDAISDTVLDDSEVESGNGDVITYEFDAVEGGEFLKATAERNFTIGR